MQKIGIVASDSSEEKALSLLQEGFEAKAKAEDLVIVKNRVGNDVLGVLRGGAGMDESLRVGAYRPSIAYAKKGGSPSGAREVFSFGVKILGSLLPDRNGISRSRTIIAPRSDVILLEEGDNPDPMQLIVGKKQVNWLPNAYYEDRRSWKIPSEPDYLNYHVGIFGSTGCGKSYLARYSIIPLFQESKYRILVLDWSGVDYAPYYGEKTLGIGDIALNEEVIVEYLCSKMGHFGFRGEYRTSNAISDLVEDFVGNNWLSTVSTFSTPEALREGLGTAVRTGLAQVEQRYRDRWTRSFERGFRKLTEEHLKVIMGKKKVEDVVYEIKDITVIDMHKVGSDEKLSFFATLGNHLKDLMDSGEELNLALVIDEGPQYCPWEPRGMQYEATELIKELCALGRKHKLSVVLLSQGISGEIGINASVRRNLNTQFFGRIHPLDMMEAGNWLSPYGITPDELLTLEPGYFYYSGRLNPSPIPLLMTFSIEV